jgi:FkbM family methyltransferase
MEAASALKPYIHTEADLKTGIYKYKKDIKVKVRTLDKLFETDMADIKSIDVMSVDLEGGELDAIKGFTKKELYPKVFVIECPYENRNAAEAAQFSSIGYKLVHKQQINHFYMKA